MDLKDFKDQQKNLSQIINNIKELKNTLNIDSLKDELSKLEKETLKEDFWKDKDNFAKVNQDISKLKRRIDPFKELENETSESFEFMELALVEEDMDILNDIVKNISLYQKRLDNIETTELLSEEDDFSNAFITIHPGAGGTESQDWANMLFRMYYRWCEKKNFNVDVIDYTPGEEAGIKSSTLLIKGDFCFGLLKGEKGVHRLVRMSPFDSNKRRHTSFASVEIIPEVSEDMEVDINESDLRIDTYRSSGAGGQHVNTSDSAVRITHIPTGVVVQCQNQRSQHKNKASAMKVLKAKIYELHKKERADDLLQKAGDKKGISWGNQIRSYVFQPYTMVKDHRTNEETGNVEAVFDGDIDRFIDAYLKSLKKR